MPRVEYDAAFRTDLSHQLTYLADREDLGAIDRLQADIADLADMLAIFPLAGRELARDDGETLRRIRLRNTPFAVWYRFEPTLVEAAVVLHRLFHVRQRTPRPR